MPYLDCNHPDGTIGVEPTPYSPDYTYEWSTINGTIMVMVIAKLSILQM
ncbi:MAG: hypothetical protein LC127_10355 [Chitinophagales bacterium]|nr:hypothetical protein [Chitinophagales bacterium]